MSRDLIETAAVLSEHGFPTHPLERVPFHGIAARDRTGNVRVHTTVTCRWFPARGVEGRIERWSELDGHRICEHCSDAATPTTTDAIAYLRSAQQILRGHRLLDRVDDRTENPLLTVRSVRAIVDVDAHPDAEARHAALAARLASTPCWAPGERERLVAAAAVGSLHHDQLGAFAEQVTGATGARTQPWQLRSAIAHWASTTEFTSLRGDFPDGVVAGEEDLLLAAIEAAALELAPTLRGGPLRLYVIRTRKETYHARIDAVAEWTVHGSGLRPGIVVALADDLLGRWLDEPWRRRQLTDQRFDVGDADIDMLRRDVTDVVARTDDADLDSTLAVVVRVAHHAQQPAPAA